MESSGTLYIARREDKKPVPKTLPILYGHHLCPFVERVRIVLAYHQIPYQSAQMDLTKRPRWYKLLNPTRKVPTYEFPDGRVIYESDILIEMLDSLAIKAGSKKPPLFPEDPVARAQMKLKIQKYTAFIGQFYKVIYRLMEMQDLQGEIEDIMKVIEEDLEKSGSRFLNGSDRITALDVLVYPHLIRNIWMKDSVYSSVYKTMNGDRFKYAHAYCNRLYNDPLFKSILTIKSGFLHQMADFKKNGRMALKLPVKL